MQWFEEFLVFVFFDICLEMCVVKNVKNKNKNKRIKTQKNKMKDCFCDGNGLQVCTEKACIDENGEVFTSDPDTAYCKECKSPMTWETCSTLPECIPTC